MLLLSRGPSSYSGGFDGALRKHSGCIGARPLEATATRLMELSSKAQEQGEGYAIRTARAAAGVAKHTWKTSRNCSPW